jgi:hypothetical protein
MPARQLSRGAVRLLLPSDRLVKQLLPSSMHRSWCDALLLCVQSDRLRLASAVRALRCARPPTWVPCVERRRRPVRPVCGVRGWWAGRSTGSQRHTTHKPAADGIARAAMLSLSSNYRGKPPSADTGATCVAILPQHLPPSGLAAAAAAAAGARTCHEGEGCTLGVADVVCCELQGTQAWRAVCCCGQDG